MNQHLQQTNEGTPGRTRIKICGIRKLEDARVAVNAGADAIGLVFYPASPRAVEIQQAKQIAQGLPPFVSLTGLFVNATHAAVESVLRSVALDLLQFHGDETADFCSQFGRRWIKAIRVQAAGDIERAFDAYPDANGLLVDAFSAAAYGGTGQVFDWSLIPQHRPLPLVLAGGLTVDNVAQAIRTVKPWGVDVSGGVEKSKGIKDQKLMMQFIQEVQSV